MKYRDRYQLIADVIIATIGGARKTNIMYEANLSWDLLKRHLSLVIECGLVKHGDVQKDVFYPTQKGKEYLNEFTRERALKKKLDEINLDRYLIQ